MWKLIKSTQFEPCIFTITDFTFKMELVSKIVKEHCQWINHNKKRNIIFQLIHIDWKRILKRHQQKANMGSKMFNVRKEIATRNLCWNMSKKKNPIRKICKWIIQITKHWSWNVSHRLKWIDIFTSIRKHKL